MESPPITVAELLEENLRLRERHAKEIAGQAQCLRDEFASKALIGLLSCSDILLGDEERYATRAYEYADAMLRARQQAPEGRS